MVNALEIRDLHKSYSPSMIALHSVSLSVQKGDFFALLGPNGAGKSTLISIISSLVKKSSGKVKIAGLDIDEQFEQARKKLGVVPQEFNFNTFERVRDIVLNQAGYYGIPRAQAAESADKYLKKLGLWDKRDVSSRFLSGGMKRRLMIARALVHEPEILVLDEPTAGVDIELRRSMWAFLEEVNAQGTTIILTTHYLEEAESLCRNVAILDKGNILENTSMAKLLSQLHRETFVFDILPGSPLPDLEKLKTLAEYAFNDVGEGRFEVSIERGQSLNALFAELNALDIQVASMRNKANRLEELFVDLVQGSGENQ